MTTTGSTKKKKVAIVGGGVSGLSAAWHLSVNCSASHEVTLFEKEETLGGHAHTVTVDDDLSVDVGFMVFNEDNYPNMIRWFRALGVDQEDSDMSLSVSLDKGKTIEWSSDGINGLLARRTQALYPSFYTFLRDMLRFNQQAPELLRLAKDDPRRVVTTGQYLRDHGYSKGFATYYLLPMMAALWSASIEDVAQFPAEQLIGFLCNHKMLQIFNRPQWKTVAGRSKTYTQKLQDLLGDQVKLATPIGKVQKKPSGTYELFGTDQTSMGVFDEVVFGCHPPLALALLKDSTNQTLKDCLSKIEYADNVIYVHSDPSLMPKRRRAWASWNCLGRSQHLNLEEATKGEAMEGGASGFGRKVSFETEPEGPTGRMKAVYVTYWLNRLQNLKTDKDIFVSLNPHHRPNPGDTYKRMHMAHPQFNPGTLVARELLEKDLQGKDGLWFCGAWQGYGFHEDGCRSGFNVATKLSQVPLPWADGAIEKVLPPPDLSRVDLAPAGLLSRCVSSIYSTLTYEIPVALCRRFLYGFLRQAVKKGILHLKLNDGSIVSFGDGTPCGCDHSPVTLRIFDDWFFVKTTLEYDLGLARSYMAGHFVVEPLHDAKEYDAVIRPPNSRDETNVPLGDPVGLTRLFLLLIGNRDLPLPEHQPQRSARAHLIANALSNASGLIISRIGSLMNFLHYRLKMDNSERGGSRKNIRAHYDLSNDLFRTFLDQKTLTYSSAIYDAVKAPLGRSGLVFRGTLEDAQVRKLDTLLERAQVQPGQQVLDIGFGWGGLAIHAAKKYGCQVTGITLSVEQKALAEKRVKKEGLENLISFEVVDYRVFARRRENLGKFDRVLSCEMIEAVGHEHLTSYFWAVEQVLKQDGIFVMEAITTPEQRYETYKKSTDFINSIIFPGSCCPSLHALVDAAYKGSTLTLEHIDNIGLHYAATLAEWRRRFNTNEALVRRLGFDDVFLRAWNYYLTYCEAAFFSQTENCLILVFARQGCRALVPLCETRSVTQAKPLTESEISNWMKES